MFKVNSGDLDIAIRTIIGEARGEELEGQRAVAHVIINRTRHPQFRKDNTVAMTCLRYKQFSCWNLGDPNFERIQNESIVSKYYRKALLAFNMAMEDDDITNGATHYHTTGVAPRWSVGKTPCATFGTHVFFKDID